VKIRRDGATPEDVRLRWSGHRLMVRGRLVVPPGLPVSEADGVVADAERRLRAALPAVGRVDVTVTARELSPAS
jgi:divalent metal cation (Fe/Co/Zn/Cd) transporter